MTAMIAMLRALNMRLPMLRPGILFYHMRQTLPAVASFSTNVMYAQGCVFTHCTWHPDQQRRVFMRLMIAGIASHRQRQSAHKFLWMFRLVASL